jgi:two-component system, cell cycle response regulator
MPNDPHITLEFPRVVPLETSPPPYEEERPTQPGAQTAPVASASQDRPLLTVLVGLNAGQVFTLARDESLIGRGRDAHVLLDDVGISRRHARIVRTSDRRYVLEDLGSANGIFVNGRKTTRAELASGDRVQIGPALVLRFRLIAADEEALAHKLYEGSTRDALTGLYNRKYATERLVAEVAYAHRHGTLLALVIFDLDHFKRVNDTYGHPAGDGVLRVVAAQVQKAIRAEDVLARYGGEEFVVLVRGIELKGVTILAERVRGGVERLSIPWQSRTLKATISVGVASLSECGPKATAEALVALADERLYAAKDGGRNRVCSAGPSPTPGPR